MVKDVLKEPGGNERRIQERMDPDHFVLFLDRSEDEVFFWGALPFAAPGDGVAFQRVTEIFGI